LVAVAEFASTVAAATEVAVCPPTAPTVVADCVPVTSPERVPVKDVAEVAVVAVEAFPNRLPVTFPVRLAITVPAIKFPDASLLTIADAVFVGVAALALETPEATCATV
jgi:hypothetical protein